MTFLFLILATWCWANVNEPLSRTRTHLHLAKQNPIYGDGARLTIETTRYPDETVHLLTTSATARGRQARVVSASTAKLIEEEMSKWMATIGKSKGGLTEIGCTLPLRTERARVRSSLCLTGLPAAERNKFFDWYQRTADLAR